MKLYELQRGNRFTIHIDGDSMIYTLHNIDGMYSYCTDESGNVFHIAAYADVVNFEEGEK